MSRISAPLAAAVKQSLLTLGRYSRVLERTTFPGVAVLCYHGVRDNTLAKRTIPLQDLHIRTSTFMSHCRLIRETCHPISLDDLRSVMEGRSKLPERPVLIDFGVARRHGDGSSTERGALLGSPVAGYAYDFFGSYGGAILAGAALCLVSFVITLLTPEPARWLAARKPSP